jgi:hypothetical protein
MGNVETVVLAAHSMRKRRGLTIICGFILLLCILQVNLFSGMTESRILTHICIIYGRCQTSF